MSVIKFEAHMFRLVIWSIIISCLMFHGAWAQPPFAPVLKENGQKWKIGYMEGGPYPHYAFVLKSLVQNLAEMGWLPPLGPDFPWASEDTREIWSWLATRGDGPYLSFPASAFWSPGWDTAKRGAAREAALARLAGKKDLSAVLALGTWAGQDLANDEHSTPVLVFQTTDPVAAGIVKSAQDSGRLHVFAHCDPQRYRRQVAMFHEFIPFKSLGVAYEDSPEGRAYASLEDVEAVAREQGFAIERCHTKTNVPDIEEAVSSYEACHRDLAGRADAVYLTHSRALTAETAHRLLAPFQERRIPTFAMGGAEFVKKGALLSMAQTDFKALGRFFAETLGRCLHGAPPGSLNQVFEDDPTIALNMQTAKNVGFIPSLEVLSAASLVVEKTE